MSPPLEPNFIRMLPFGITSDLVESTKLGPEVSRGRFLEKQSCFSPIVPECESRFPRKAGLRDSEPKRGARKDVAGRCQLGRGVDGEPAGPGDEAVDRLACLQ